MCSKNILFYNVIFHDDDEDNDDFPSEKTILFGLVYMW